MEGDIQKLSRNKSLLNPLEQQKHKFIYTEQWD
jgi:hypothetical protein